MIIHNNEFNSDEAFDLSTTWINLESNSPLGGPSNEESIGTSLGDKLVAPSNSSPSSRPVPSEVPPLAKIFEESGIYGHFDCQ